MSSYGQNSASNVIKYYNALKYDCFGRRLAMVFLVYGHEKAKLNCSTAIIINQQWSFLFINKRKCQRWFQSWTKLEPIASKVYI